MLLGAVLTLGACGAASSVQEVWVQPQHTDGLQAAVDEASTASGTVTLHLLAGTHHLTRPLVLDARHAGTQFIGHGKVSISGAVEIGAPPHDGSRNISTWTVVGKADCFGCSDIWRAAIPSGLDSRHVWVNGRRANRTWVGMPLGAQKTDTGTAFTVPGEQMLHWVHNASAIELVYRGAGSAGSQWTESRCPRSIDRQPHPASPWCSASVGHLNHHTRYHE